MLQHYQLFSVATLKLAFSSVATLKLAFSSVATLKLAFSSVATLGSVATLIPLLIDSSLFKRAF